jgi:hypothetical protein
MTLAGGANGITKSASLTEFPPNGATSGGFATAVTGTTYQPIQNAALPVTFNCFTINTHSQDLLQVNWIVYDEVNVHYYQLEESHDSRTWKAVHKNFALPTLSVHKEYNISIIKPAVYTYYRLKAIDYDSSSQYSCVRFFKPSVNKIISIVHTGNKINIRHKEKLTGLRLYNILGQDIKIPVMSGTALSSIEVSNLKNGVYFLKLRSESEEMVYKFLK